MEKKYWKGIEELRNDAEFVRLKNDEFYEPLPIDEVINKKAEDVTVTPRRDFLKFLGDFVTDKQSPMHLSIDPDAWSPDSEITLSTSKV